MILSGCNVENAAYPLSTCAERVAITKAISQAETEEDKEIVSIAVAAKYVTIYIQVLLLFLS